MTVYSKEDKERILADFYESGMTPASFGRLPGKPHRKTIKAWLELEEQNLLNVARRDVRGRATRHTLWARYSNETIYEAVRLRSLGMKRADVKRRLNISNTSSIALWEKYATLKNGSLSPKEAVRKMEEFREKNKQSRGPRKKNSTKEAKRIAELESQLEEAQLELAVLREMMRNPKVADPTSLSNAQKSELGERLRRDYGYSLKEIIGFLKMPKSTYAYNVGAQRKKIKRKEEVDRLVLSAFRGNGQTYGYRRIWACVSTYGQEISQREVRKSMQRQGLHPRLSKANKKYSSYKGEDGTRPENIPLGERGKHNFYASEPGLFAVTDITEFKIGHSKKVYLAPMIDCFDGMPASWEISEKPNSKLCNTALRSYLDTLPQKRSVVIHTDGGCQYTANSWKAICAEYGVTRSMSRKGRCPDNARAEGFFGTIKREFFYGKNWSSTTPKEFIKKLDAYLKWYRDERLKAFQEDGKVVYDTITGRRKRLGHKV